MGGDGGSLKHGSARATAHGGVRGWHGAIAGGLVTRQGALLGQCDRRQEHTRRCALDTSGILLEFSKKRPKGLS